MKSKSIVEKNILIEKKKAVLRKFYGGKRQPWMHKLRITDGKCEYCGTFLGDAIKQKFSTMCKQITPDEVSHFRNYED